MPTSLPYRWALRATRALAPVASGLGAKLAQSVEERRFVAGRLAAFGNAGRDDRRPLAWFHAPSVGEGLQARAVLDRFRARHPEWQLAYTWFSPSAASFGRELHVDFADCLPWDTVPDIDRAIATLRPSLLVFAKLDVWPELATRAAAHGSRVALVAGTVRPGSGRLKPIVRGLLRPGYQAVDAAGAVSLEDGERLAQLGIDPARIVVTGDPRTDSVLARVEASSVEGLPPALLDAASTLVAGSTWPGDEDVLLHAFRAVGGRHPATRLVIVPHEPTADAVERIGRLAASLGLPAPVRLSALQQPAPLVLVDRFGLLATLYGVANVAYVGGGFGRAGLHSVLEPAAWGVPVLFGPRWHQSRDAERLILGGGARAIPHAGAAEVLRLFWSGWLENDAERTEAGQRAQAVALEERGAADRSVTLIEGLLRPRG